MARQAKTLEDLFQRHAQVQYTRELTFSAVTGLMIQVVLRTYGSVHAAYRQQSAPLPVSITAVYDKLAGLETHLSEALVRETADAMTDLIAALPAEPAETAFDPTGLLTLLREWRDAAAQNAYLERHSWDEYAAWHLGLTAGANDET